MGYEDDDQWQQQQDMLDQERLALDCLIVIHKDYGGTADALAPLLGINKLWQQTKAQLQRKAA
jgi:hypothetical protein